VSDEWDPWKRYWREQDRLQWDPWYRYEYEKDRERWDPWFRYWKEQDRLSWDPWFRHMKEEERMQWDPWYRTLKEIERKHWDKESRYGSGYEDRERYESMYGGRREPTEEEKRSLELLRAISLYNQLYDRGSSFWLKLALQIGALGFLGYLIFSLLSWRPPLP